jgi:hypothetical protein
MRMVNLGRNKQQNRAIRTGRLHRWGCSRRDRRRNCGCCNRHCCRGRRLLNLCRSSRRLYKNVRRSVLMKAEVRRLYLVHRAHAVCSLPQLPHWVRRLVCSRCPPSPHPSFHPATQQTKLTVNCVLTQSHVVCTSGRGADLTVTGGSCGAGLAGDFVVAPSSAFFACGIRCACKTRRKQQIQQ